jgi:hypothetical protein
MMSLLQPECHGHSDISQSGRTFHCIHVHGCAQATLASVVYLRVDMLLFELEVDPILYLTLVRLRHPVHSYQALAHDKSKCVPNADAVNLPLLLS